MKDFKQYTITFLGEFTPKVWYNWLTVGEVLEITKEFSDHWRGKYGELWKIETRLVDSMDLIGRLKDGYKGLSMGTVEKLKIIIKDMEN